MTRSTLTVLALCCAVSALRAADAAPAPAPEPLTFYGDLRLRYERDWDSQNAAGVARANRERERIRARLGFTYRLPGAWSANVRVRTGNPLSQQSPHLTFAATDNLNDDFAVQADRYFLQYKSGPLTAWGGRNTTPFWQQNEMWWDEDVTSTGVAASYDRKLAAGTLTTTGAVLGLPDGMRRLNGTLVGAQAKFTRSGPSGQLILAAGLYSLTGKNGAKNLRNRNGARDYLLGVASAQWTLPATGGYPVVLGADLIKNFASYDAADVAPFAARQEDETNGYVFSVLLGQLKQPRDWQVGYFYAHIETLAVNASYSQDDWARFGSGPQADVTDFKGSEFRATCVLTKSINVAARLFLVDAITSVQDGKRVRVDLNYKF
jgi:hypothetical protein